MKNINIDVVEQMKQKDKNDMVRLLNDGQLGSSILDCSIDTLQKDGKTYLCVADLIDWVSRMADHVVSDQKQEVYRGLRAWLHLFQ